MKTKRATPPITKIVISHVVTLVVHPTSKELASARGRLAQSVESLLSVAKGKPIVMSNLRHVANLLPQADTGDEAVLAAIATAVAQKRMVLQVNIRPPKKTKVTLSTLWSNYPTEVKYPTSIVVDPNIWKLVGGKVLYNATHEDPARPGHMIFENSCATRMSHAFNNSKLDIPNLGTVTSTGGNGKHYIFRVEVLRSDVVRHFGPATVLDNATWMDEMEGQPGIVLFTSTFRDATGHATLWDGTTLINGAADENDARPSVLKKVEFWELQP